MNTIYIAASYRHLHAVRMLTALIRDVCPGVTILDWTTLATPPEGLTTAERRAWMDTDHGGRVYDFCAQACTSADLVIYLGASGQDAGVEVGMARAAGVPVLGVRGPLEAPGLMLHGAVGVWCLDVEHALCVISQVATCNCPDPLLCADDACGYLPVCPCGRALAQEVTP